MQSEFENKLRIIGNMGSIKSKPEKKVLVLYTGGTIGMVRNENGVLIPAPNTFKDTIRSYPQLHDVNYVVDNDYLVLPCTTESSRILYTIKEYNPLLDSSDMSIHEWIRIATDIKNDYHNYDGFVILHGTDTLIYTSSVLSFMLENLGKTVVVTGSQIPIFETRSDGQSNLSVSLLFASGIYNIPEVTVFFANKLYRGNRTVKVSASSFDAFDSMNIAPLASVGINVEVDNNSIFRPTNQENFFAHTNLNENVGILRFYPNITSDIVQSFLKTPCQGLIIQSYGEGNIPSNREDLLNVLKKATKNGIIIVNCTQCAQGAVEDNYEAAEDDCTPAPSCEVRTVVHLNTVRTADLDILREAGVISGKDMTSEAAYTKLCYVLSKDWDINTKREIMSRNIRGELTTNE